MIDKQVILNHIKNYPDPNIAIEHIMAYLKGQEGKSQPIEELVGLINLDIMSNENVIVNKLNELIRVFNNKEIK